VHNIDSTIAPPPGVADSGLVTRLRDSDVFQRYRRAFQAATGLPLLLRGRDSFEVPLPGPRVINPFCALLASNHRTCAACLERHERPEQHSSTSGEDCSVECFAGLMESAIPVRVGDEIVAYLRTGQVMLRHPTESRFNRARRTLPLGIPAITEARLRAAYFECRVMTRPQYRAILQLLSSFAQHLSLLSNELMITRAANEPPMLIRARAFIGDHLTEKLSLGQVARAVHVSATYFCKLFKTGTGINFTDYVARVRVERVKQLLLNPHKRVSEAAYEAGFQSMSQFNRAFRRIAGEAPSFYRDRVQAAMVARGHPRLPVAA